MGKLFKPFELAGTTLSSRVVMAPMTRARTKDATADAETALYYRQRAGAGLIIAEGADVSMQARGNLFTAGIFTRQHVEGWRMTTDAVHAAGGRIFLQLSHAGRASHWSLQANGLPPVSSTAVPAADTTAFANDDSGRPGRVPASAPRALSLCELEQLRMDFVLAARRAIEAGFDGVEVHAGNGFLFEQFINGALNDRLDGYGGPLPEHRLRLLLETLGDVAEAVGSARVGVKVTPFSRLGDMQAFTSERATWMRFAELAAGHRLAYVHAAFGAVEDAFKLQFRKAFDGVLMVPGCPVADVAESALQEGRADLVVLGRPFIANPDLVERMRHGWPLAQAQEELIYGGGAQGYTDYPSFQPHDVTEAKRQRGEQVEAC